MGESRLARVMLQYDVDRRSLRDAERANDAVISSLREIAQASDQTGVAAKRTGQKLSKLNADVVGRADTAASALATLSGSLGSVGSEALGVVGDALGAADAMGAMGMSMSAALPIALALAAAMAGFAALVNELNRAFEAGRRAVQAYGRALQAQHEAETMTQEELLRKREEVNRQLQNAQADLVRLEEAQTQAWQDLNETGLGVFSDFGARLAVLVADTPVEEYNDLIEKQKDLVADLAGEMSGLNEALLSGATATRDLLARTDEAAQREVERAQLLRTATVAGIEDAIVSSQDLVTALDHQIVALRASGDTSGEVALRIMELQRQRDQELDRIRFLDTEVRAMAETREREAQAAERARQKQEIYRQQLEETARAEAQRRKDIAGQVDRYNKDVARIQEDALKQRIQIEDRFANAQVQIAEQAADASEAALAKLQETQRDLRRNLVRDEEKAAREQQQAEIKRQIAFQRDEAKATRDHQRNLLNILRAAARQEEDLAAERDFAGLFRLKRDTADRLAEENRSFGEARQERALEFQQERADAAREFAIERQERWDAFQQRMADAQAQYDMERAQIAQQKAERLAEARAQFQAEMTDLKAQFAERMNQRRQQALEELRFLAQTEAQRKAIVEQTQNALLAQAKTMLAGLGNLGALTGTVNTQTTNRTATQNNTFNIANPNPTQTAAQVARFVQRAFSFVMG